MECDTVDSSTLDAQHAGILNPITRDASVLSCGFKLRQHTLANYSIMIYLTEEIFKFINDVITNSVNRYNFIY